jgi:hypothetical protein
MSGKAESRLIYNSISTSERVSTLGVKGALVYTWLLTHCDCQGRLQGKPRIVKHDVVPFLDEITIPDIEKSLELMQQQKLIMRYQDKTGRELIQVLDWWEWQTGLKYKAASHYEAPKDWEDKLTPREGGKFAKESSE